MLTLHMIFGLVGTFGIAIGILWVVNKYVLKREQTVLEMTWMIVLALIVVSIAGVIMSKGIKIAPVPKLGV